MVSIEEMREWNYRKIYNFFFTNASSNEHPEEQSQYVMDQKGCKTVDMRDKHFPIRLLERFVNGSMLIIVDGASFSGKRDFAKKIASINPHVAIVDIEELTRLWLEEREKTMNPITRSFQNLNLEQKRNEYLAENLENIVMQASENGEKTVILVGVFLGMMKRLIVADKIGRYFKKVVSVVLQESMDVILSRVEKGKNLYPVQPTDSQIDRVRWEAAYVDELTTSPEMKKLLGICADYSFIVNGRTVDIT